MGVFGPESARGGRGRLSRHSRRRPGGVGHGSVGVLSRSSSQVGKPHPQSDVAKGDEIPILNGHAVDGLIVDVCPVGLALVLENQLFPVPTHLTLLPRNVGAQDLKGALRTPTHQDHGIGVGEALSNAGTSEHLYLDLSVHRSEKCTSGIG